MIGGEGGVRIRAVLVGEVDLPVGGQRREVGQRLLPSRVDLPPIPLHQRNGLSERPAPVVEIEGGVEHIVGVVVLLYRDHGGRGSETGLIVPVEVVDHEGGRLLDDRLPGGEERGIGPAARQQRTIEDRMRLLPAEEATDGRGGVTTVRLAHLRPPRPAVPLLSCPFFGAREYLQVPGEGALQELALTPEREVGAVEEVHLQMELAVPRVAGQAGLRRGELPAALDGQEVARQQDPPLQLIGSLIC